MRTPPKKYISRLLDQRIASLLSELPAILIVGPRACGKTTTAARFAATTVRLDREAEAAAFQADPDVALRGLPEPILLDEWQVVPGVLGAIKRSVDDDPRPGRFLVTGSVRSDLLAATWPGTGRLVRVALHGLTMREQLHGINRPSLLERLIAGGPEALLESITEPPNLMEYLEFAVQSGFPEPAAGLSLLAREAWLESYIEQLLTRDVELIDSGRDPDRLKRYLRAYSSMTARIVTEKTLFAAAGIDRRTAVAYEQLLMNLFVVEQLPSWSTNRVKQLVRAPKRHVVDSGLAASVLRVDAQGILRSSDLLGSILETFVLAQIRAEAEAAARRPRLFHLRTKGGRHEVDLIVELPNDRLVAIEIKAGSAPNRHDARHLFMLEESLGERLLAGVLFHTGPRAFSLGRRIVAAPIASLWS